MSVIVFTKAYRDKHWRKCRFGLDPRNCGSEGRVTDCYLRYMVEGPVAYCKRDHELCDARWEE